MTGTQAVLCYKRRISAANLNEASSKTSVFPLSGCVSGFLFLRWSFNFPFFIHAKTVNCVWKCPDPVTSLSDIFAGFTCWSVLILADGNNFQQQSLCTWKKMRNYFFLHTFLLVLIWIAQPGMSWHSEDRATWVFNASITRRINIVLGCCHIACTEEHLTTWHCHGSGKSSSCNPWFVLYS